MTGREIGVMVVVVLYVLWNEYRWWEVRQFAKAVTRLPSLLSPAERERIERDGRRAAVEEGRDV